MNIKVDLSNYIPEIKKFILKNPEIFSDIIEIKQDVICPTLDKIKFKFTHEDEIKEKTINFHEINNFLSKFNRKIGS